MKFTLSDGFFETMAEMPDWHCVIQQIGDMVMEKAVPHLSPELQNRFRMMETEFTDTLRQEAQRYAASVNAEP